MLHKTPDLTLHVNSYMDAAYRRSGSGYWFCNNAIQIFWPEASDVIQLVVHEHPSKNRVKITNADNQPYCPGFDYLFDCDGKLVPITQKGAKILKTLLDNRKAVYVECLIDD